MEDPMATGPQRYPGADQTHRYQGVYGGDAMEVNVVVLHTTEGRSLPDYGGGASAPNLTAVPDLSAKKLKWYQHFDIDTSARALVNLSGGVETNTLNVCQIELVGTCDPKTHAKWEAADQAHVYWPDAPDWALQGVARFLGWMREEHGVPLTGPGRWPAYPTSYANGGGQRMTGAQWESFKGVCGHMHVPENTHGDPGAIDFARLLTMAKGISTPPTPVTQPPAPRYQPFPGGDWFRKAPRSAIVTAMGKRLVAVGCSAYAAGPGPQWTEADRRSYAKWQRRLGYTGTAADGWPGAKSWAALKVPHV